MFLYNPDQSLTSAAAGEVTVADLTNWQSSDDQLSIDAAAEAGFGVVKLEGGYQGRVIVRDVSMSARRTVDGRECDIGCSVRLVVKVIGEDLKGDLSLPAVSAKAELGMLRASADLTVLGFANMEVFGEFPSFEKLDIDGFGKYTAAADGIRKLIARHKEDIRPGVIRVLPEKVDEGDYPRAVGVVFALKAIADGRSLDESLQGRPADWADYYQAIADTYQTVAGIKKSAGDERPDRSARNEARAWLAWT